MNGYSEDEIDFDERMAKMSVEKELLDNEAKRLKKQENFEAVKREFVTKNLTVSKRYERQ